MESPSVQDFEDFEDGDDFIERKQAYYMKKIAELKT
jgi:hypothetical protein